MWRPKDWSVEQIRLVTHEAGKFADNDLVEAGADAILIALVNKPSSRKIENYCEYYGEIPKSGTWVFIPDKEEE